MIAIALMSQTLRAEDCAALLRSQAGRWIVVTGDEHVPDQADLPPGSSVLRLSSPLAGPAERLGSRIRRASIRWMRGGSRAGRAIERGLQKVRRLLSPAGGSSRPRGPGDPPTSRLLDTHTEMVLSILEEQQEGEGVSEILVFDLFDLPAAVAFGDQHGVPIRVR